MKFREIHYLLFIFLFLQSCGSNSVNDNKTICALQAPFEYFDQIDKTDFHFADLDYRLNQAKGKNKTDEVNKVSKEFETAQNSCMQKLEARFPVGAIKLPFEQTGGRDTLTVTAAYVSGFAFPWNTATSICYYFTMEYNLTKKDIWYATIPLTFLDSEGDILYICHLTADASGKARFLVKTQPSFIKFVKISIN